MRYVQTALGVGAHTVQAQMDWLFYVLFRCSMRSRTHFSCSDGMNVRAASMFVSDTDSSSGCRVARALLFVLSTFCRPHATLTQNSHASTQTSSCWCSSRRSRFLCPRADVPEVRPGRSGPDWPPGLGVSTPLKHCDRSQTYLHAHDVIEQLHAQGIAVYVSDGEWDKSIVHTGHATSVDVRCTSRVADGHCVLA